LATKSDCSYMISSLFHNILSQLKWVTNLGTSLEHTESTNRITIFTNVLIIFGFLVGASLASQLVGLGVEIKYLLFMLFIISMAWVVPFLNSKGKLFAARAITMAFGIIIGWQSLLIFGRDFAGYQLYVVAMIYSVLAFSQSPLRVRIAMTTLAWISAPIYDYFIFAEIPSVTGMTAQDLPFAVMLVNNVLFCGLIIIMVWIEKSKADIYEAGLQTALLNVQREKQRIQVIFDNVSQGIVAINSQLRIEPDYSSFLNEIFPNTEFAGEEVIESILSKSTLTPDAIATVKSTMDFCIGEDELNWDINSGQFPMELTIPLEDENKTLALSWSPIVEDETVTQIILSITDMTERRRYEKMEADNKQKAHITQSIFEAIAKSGLSQVHQFNGSLENIITMIKDDVWKNDPKTFGRDLHGLKGEARLLELSDIAQEVHTLETSISEKNNLEKHMSDYSKIFSTYLEASKKIIDPLAGESSLHWSLLAFVGELKKRALNQLDGSETKIELGTIRCEDSVAHWPEAFVRPVQNILLHSVQNSIDHGYLLRGLDRNVEIAIQARQKENGFELLIEDFGAGLNMEKVMEKFHELPESQRRVMSSPTDVLFMDNTSTAETVSMTSGRGVGLSAVKAEVDDLHGQLVLENCENHKGTQLRVFMPFAEQKQALAS
jgi:HPt (histidine-containing phosphotransfer) domain-containing protein